MFQLKIIALCASHLPHCVAYLVVNNNSSADNIWHIKPSTGCVASKRVQLLSSLFLNVLASDVSWAHSLAVANQTLHLLSATLAFNQAACNQFSVNRHLRRREWFTPALDGFPSFYCTGFYAIILTFKENYKIKIWKSLKWWETDKIWDKKLLIWFLIHWLTSLFFRDCPVLLWHVSI